MGPLNTNYQAEPAAATAGINHFAHQHLLQLSHHHNPQTPCSACTHPASTPAYGCEQCNYYLHVSCSTMPQQLQHPFDTNKTHALRLLPKPVYPEGVFSCDACGHQGSGFSYHCSECRIDLHVLCSALPSVVSVPGHQCQLTRVFTPPYGDSKFMCDVCRTPGSKTWLYHCGTCQFDVHLGCIRGTQQQARVATRSVSYPQPQHMPRYHQPQPNPNSYNHGQPVMGQPANNTLPYYNQPVAKPAGSKYFNAIAEGLVNGIAEAVGQNVANAAIGAALGGDGLGAAIGAALGGDGLGAGASDLYVVEGEV